jgi:hypothetical protein
VIAPEITGGQEVMETTREKEIRICCSSLDLLIS